MLSAGKFPRCPLTDVQPVHGRGSSNSCAALDTPPRGLVNFGSFGIRHCHYTRGDDSSSLPGNARVRGAFLRRLYRDGVKAGSRAWLTLQGDAELRRPVPGATVWNGSRNGALDCLAASPAGLWSIRQTSKRAVTALTLA